MIKWPKDVTTESSLSHNLASCDLINKKGI